MSGPITQPKANQRKRRTRIILVCAAVVLLLPAALLQLTAFLFWKHGRAMLSYDKVTITNGSGQTVRWFEQGQTNAEWNIILIHGTPGAAADYKEQFEHPFPGANLLALNRPGFGGSKPVLRQPHLAVQAEAIGEALARLTNRPAILVGHSYGAPVAVWSALEFTNQVAGVVLIGGAMDPGMEHPYLIQRMGNWRIISWILPHALRQANRELMTLKGDLLQLQSNLPALSVPVVMLHGRKDPLVPVSNVEYLRNELAQAGKTNLFDALIYSNYNHFIPWEHPDAVSNAIHRVIGMAPPSP